MHVFILLAVIAATASARTIIIAAGLKGSTFFPAIMTANVGDVLEFQFFYSNHSAVQSEFNTPCQQSASGFDSGPFGYNSNEVFQIVVEDMGPIWYFCATPGHCQGGMAGVINPPPPLSNQTIDAYIWNAMNTSSSISSGRVQGGHVLPVSSSSSTSGPTPTSSSMSSSIGSGTPSSITTSPSSTQSSVTTGSAGSFIAGANSRVVNAVLGVAIVSLLHLLL